MAGIDNLRPFRKGEQRTLDAQLRSAKKKSSNAKKKAVLRDAFVEILNGKMDVSEVLRDGASMMGTRLGKRESFGKILMLTITQDALKKKNWKAIVELAKLAGVTFDQSPEGLGGEENPINVSNAVNVSPDRVRQISAMLEDEC